MNGSGSREAKEANLHVISASLALSGDNQPTGVWLELATSNYG